MLDRTPPRSDRMMQRISALEAQGEAQRGQIACLMAMAVASAAGVEGAKEYDAAEDRFSDGCCIDWFIWEPVESIHIINNVTPPRLLTASHWDATMTLPGPGPGPCTAPPDQANGGTSVELWLPVERYGDVYRMITLPERLTVRQFFTAVHAFYDSEIVHDDLRDHDLTITHGVLYARNALINISKGRRVTWSDLLGQRDAYWPRAASRESCSGCVRFEGLRKKGRDLVLVLGS